MMESWAPVVGAGIIVGGAAVVQLAIYLHTLKERRKDRERVRVNAVRDLYWGLRAMFSQGWFTDSKTRKVDPRLCFLMYPEDIRWLRQHFHEYGHLFSAKIHESYHNAITNTQTRPMSVDEASVPSDIRKFVLPGPVVGGNLTKLYVEVGKELRLSDPDMDRPSEDEILQIIDKVPG